MYLVEYIINVFSTEYICYLESELLLPRQLTNNC